jgi:SAM-dependent methyltransferase/4-amino-4-deoxy-L-arabinose transferase-like glycosyltransferase
MPASSPDERHRQNNDDLLWQHLKSVPAFRALLRAVEARFYQHIPLPEPVLDLGCGDGHFSTLTFPGRKLTAGIDPWWNPLRKSSTAQKYNVLAQSLGHEMPFPSHYFASAISNSVLEHIPDIDPVLRETARVLRPGGQLVVTMPSHLFTENLGGAQLLGNTYRRFFNAISRHEHTDPPEVWNGRLNQAGFEITRWQYYFSTGALHTLELGHLQGLPSAFLHAFTGHWILAPWKDNLRLTNRWVRPYFEEPFPEQGAYLLIIARKVAHRPVKFSLPPAQPFTAEELTAPPPPYVPLEDNALKNNALEDSAPEIALDEIPSNLESVPGNAGVAEPDSDVHEEPVSHSPRIGSTFIIGGLGFLFILLTVLGQGAVSNNPENPAGGVPLYLLGLATFGLLVLYLRRGAPTLQLPHFAAIPLRRWLYLFALLLAFIAQRLVGSELRGGPATISLLIWLIAGGLAVYALDQPPDSHHRPEFRSFFRQHQIPLLIAVILFVAALLLRLVGLSSHPFVLNGVEASLGLDALAVGDGVIRNPFATAWLTNPTLPAYLLLLPLRLFGQTLFGVRILSVIVGALTIPTFYLLSRRVWGEGIALVAAILLCGAHAHLHYSRLGMNNIWDPLLIFLSLVFILIAYRQKTRRSWLWAGASFGISFYFYTSSHLLPIMLAGAFLYLLLVDRASLKAQGRHMLAALGLALVIALPQLLYYLANEGVFMQRVTVLGIFQSNWLGAEVARTGRSTLDLLQDQFWRAALAFHGSVDSSSSYNPGIPLFRFWSGLLLALGLVLALLRSRHFRWAMLLIWFATVILFGGALLILPPDSHRLLAALPAACLLAAAPLEWLFRRLPNQFPRLRDYALPALGLIAVLLVAGDVLFYFGPYRADRRFADRNTEIAHEIATYLHTFEEPTTAYLYGPPTIYADFPTIPFLAPNFTLNFNLFNVQEPGGPLETPRIPDPNFVYLFLPERADELSAIQAEFPDGELQQFDGHYAQPLFLAYEVER